MNEVTSDRGDIQDRLLEIDALIARLEREAAAHPQAPSLLLNLKSLKAQRRKLEAAAPGASITVDLSGVPEDRRPALLAEIQALVIRATHDPSAPPGSAKSGV